MSYHSWRDTSYARYKLSEPIYTNAVPVLMARIVAIIIILIMTRIIIIIMMMMIMITTIIIIIIINITIVI